MKSRQIAILIIIMSIMLLFFNLPSIESLSQGKITKVQQQSDTKVEKTLKISPLADIKTQTKAPKKPLKLPVTESAIATSKEVPDFSTIKDVKLKKSTFFKFMHSKIIPANKKAALERITLLDLITSYSETQQFNAEESKIYALLAKKYRVDKSDQPILSKLESLKQKIDVIPASLILAQSANESAWGTSRFARKGNNYFGQWCYSKGCGLVPSARDSGSTHEVAKFSSVQKSVEEYIYNINVGRSYKKIRQLREKMVNANKSVDSLILATGLEKYSERGKEYVKEIQSMIRYNKLQQYD